MKNIFCTGVTTFLNLCASGILEKKRTIYYLTHIEKKASVAEKYELRDIKKKKQFVSDIAFFFKYNIIFKKLSHIKITDGDMISGNLLRYLLPFLSGEKIIIFPEGSSCINYLFKKNIIKNFFTFIYKLFKTLTVGNYNVSSKWILPDRDGNCKLLINKIDNNILLPKNKLFYNIKKCSKFFVKKYPELCLCDEKNIIFHPINEHLDKSLYIKWIHKNKDLIGKKKLIVKAHENDYRSFKKIFSNFNCVIVPKKFLTLPAELIINNFKARYVGYYSSIMLHFKRKNISFIIPPDKNLIKISDNEYFGLKNLMRL
jgi:hypothetical protein